MPTQNRTVDLCDVLPIDGRTYTGVWSSTDPDAVLTSGGQAGDTAFCIEADMPSSLFTDPANPGSPPTVVTIDVVLGDDVIPGVLENQATLDFDQDGTVDVLSDDIGDSTDPRDPTTIQVLGGFEISKTVEGHPEDNDADSFPVTIVCVAADGTPHTVDATSIVDAATGAPWPGATTNGFTFSNGDDVRIQDIPAGTTCTTTEGTNPGYTTTVDVTDGGGDAGTTPGGTGAVPTGTPAGGTFVNDNCQDGGNNSPFNLQIRHTGPFNAPPSNWEMIWRDRPYSTIPGLSLSGYTHTVVPNANGLFDHVFTGTQPLPPFQNVTITGGLPSPAGDNSCATVENFIDPTPPTGGGADDGGTADGAIDTSIYEPGPVTFEITADNPEPTASFLNERVVGDLTINKTIEGLPADIDLGDEPFLVDITCVGDFTTSPLVLANQTVTANTPITIPDLPTWADCTVTEQPDPRFSTTGSPITVTIDEDGETVEIVNTTSTFSLDKVTIGSDLAGSADGTFDFAIVCTFEGTEVANTAVSITTTGNAGSALAAALPLVPPGSECVVTETVPAGWTVTNLTGGTPLGTNAIEFTTDVAGTELEFENTLASATLTINKDVLGSAATPALEAETFTVTVTCTGNFPGGSFNSGPLSIVEGTPIDIDDLPVGAVCTVSETPDPRFGTTYVPGDTLTIVDGTNEVLIENETSTFTISKTTDVPAGVNPDDTFDFAVECVDPSGAVLFSGTATITTTDGEGEWAEAPLLPPGTECTVTEQTPPTGWSIEGPNPVNITTDADSTVDAAFENTRDTADLEITKTVIGAPAGLDVTALVFTVDISCVGDFTTSPLVLADQPIADGDTITVSDLPTGAVCTVIEDADPQFAASSTPVDAATVGVTITDAGAEVAIINATGEIMIVKNTEVDSTLPIDLTESFDFFVDCGAAYSGTHTIAADTITSPTTATGFLRYSDLPALPNGTACTVTEQTAPTGWTLTSTNPVDIVVDSAGVATATFTNERDTGELTITKEIEGLPAGSILDAELFDVTVTCTGGFTTPTHVVTGQISVCLLYTSPSPRDLSTSRMPSSA